MFGTTSEGGFVNPAFRSLCKACGIACHSLTENTLGRLRIAPGPLLYHYKVEGVTTVSPKLEFNRPIDKPSPQLPEDEFSESQIIG